MLKYSHHYCCHEAACIYIADSKRSIETRSWNVNKYAFPDVRTLSSYTYENVACLNQPANYIMCTAKWEFNYWALYFERMCWIPWWDYLLYYLNEPRVGVKPSVGQVIYTACSFIPCDMMTSSNGNIFRVTGHLCGKFTGPRWIPRTKASDAELWCFLWSASE